jgi:serine protease Do
MRDGNQQTMTVMLGQLPNQQQARAGTEQSSTSAPRLGLSLAPAGTGSQGVVVVEVDSNGPAADKGIKAGDIIMNVGATAVSTPGEVQKQLAELRQAGKRSVLMRVKSGKDTRYVALPLATG